MFGEIQISNACVISTSKVSKRQELFTLSKELVTILREVLFLLVMGVTTGLRLMMRWVSGSRPREYTPRFRRWIFTP